jgi:DNA-binding transcriptional regulator GbsR (MarR family)
MTEREANFVASVGHLLGASGLPPMAGRMWGWLLICQPAEQTAAQLAEELQASRGSISSTARLLATAGLIRRATRPGDRLEHFSIPPGSVGNLLQGQLPRVVATRELMDEGLELMKDRPPESRARVEEVRDLYAFFERELPDLHARFQGSRRAGRNAGQKDIAHTN